MVLFTDAANGISPSSGPIRLFDRLLPWLNHAVEADATKLIDCQNGSAFLKRRTSARNLASKFDRSRRCHPMWGRLHRVSVLRGTLAMSSTRESVGHPTRQNEQREPRWKSGC